MCGQFYGILHMDLNCGSINWVRNKMLKREKKSEREIAHTKFELSSHIRFKIVGVLIEISLDKNFPFFINTKKNFFIHEKYKLLNHT